MVARAKDFEAALQAMEASFHVRLIGTFEPDVVCAPADDDASRWLARANPDFDQFPVKKGESTVVFCSARATSPD